MRAAAALAMVACAFAGGSTASSTATAGWIVRDLGACGSDCRANTYAINDRGQVAGSAEGMAFLWEDGRWLDLGTLGGEFSGAEALNERGQVVGSAATTERLAGEWSFLEASHAFLWSDGKMHDLGTLGGAESDAVGINERGQVVGWSETRSGATRAVLWENGKIRDLGTLGGKESRAVAINDRGQVVGWSETAKTVDRRAIIHAFLWENGQMRDLNPRRGPGSGFARAINARGQVVGDGIDGDAFVWANGSSRKIGTDDDMSIAINSRGQVLLQRFDGAKYRFLVWWNGRTRFIRAGSANDLSEGGQISGAFPGDHGRPTVWTNGKPQALPLLAGHPYGEGVDINARRQIVGWSSDVDFVYAQRRLAGPQIELMPGRIVLWTLAPASH